MPETLHLFFLSTEKRTEFLLPYMFLKCPPQKQGVTPGTMEHLTVICYWSLLSISLALLPHQTVPLKASAGTCFTLGIRPGGWSLSWELLRTITPGRVSPQVLLSESNHIWDCSITTDKTTYNCYGKTKKCRVISWVNINMLPCEPSSPNKLSPPLLGGQRVWLTVVESRLQVGLYFHPKNIL